MRTSPASQTPPVFAAPGARFEPRYLAAGAVWVPVVIAVAVTLSAAVPATNTSVLSLLTNRSDGVSGTPGWAVSLFAVFVLWRVLHESDHAPTPLHRLRHGLVRLAETEERCFREGSETWSPARRAAMCVTFGALHLASLVVPICVAVALATAGGWFMFHYLRAVHRTGSRELAVHEATEVHAAYNLTAVAVAAVAGAWEAAGWVTETGSMSNLLRPVIAAVALGWAAMAITHPTHRRQRHRRRLSPPGDPPSSGRPKSRPFRPRVV